MKGIVCRLVDDARKVRLFIGDTDGSDDATAREILAAVRELRPDLDETWVVAEPVTTFREIMESMEPLGAIIATRFHNLIAALKLAKPTIAHRLFRQTSRPDGRRGPGRVQSFDRVIRPRRRGRTAP